MKRKILSFINRCLAGVLAVLGFQACEDTQRPGCMYAPPYQEFDIKGKVTNTDKEPLKGIQVLVDFDHRTDTVYTDETGEYIWMTGGYPWANDSIQVVAKDTANIYASDMTKVICDCPDRGQAGVITAEADFELKKQ